MGRLRVGEIMSAPVVTITPDARIKHAAELMRRHDVSGLPVVSSEGALLGIVTEGDILAKEASGLALRDGGWIERLRGGRRDLEHKAAAHTVGEAMSAPVETAQPLDEVRSAAFRMASRKVKRLPVVDKGEVVGVISRRDIMRVFARPDKELKEAVERFLVECFFVPPDAEITVTVANGVVGLKGTVLYEGDVPAAAALVRSMDGVVDVINGLGHRAPNPVAGRTIA